MNQEVIDAPVPEQNAITKVIADSGITPFFGESLIAAFMPYFSKAKEVLAKSVGITVTDATQVDEIKLARVRRLELRSIRTSAENKRQELKSEYLKSGQCIDKVANVIKGMVADEEDRLLAAENFAERVAAQRKEARRVSRTILLAPYNLDLTYINLAEMDEPTFDRLLLDTRTAAEARIAAEKKAALEAAEAAAAKAKEEARIAAENERLRLENAEKDRLLAEEKERARVQAEAVAEAARLEREKAAAEAKAAHDAAMEKARVEREIAEAEVRRLKEQQEARDKVEREMLQAKAAAEQEQARLKREAELAPDREKLKAYADALEAVVVPDIRNTAIKQNIASKVAETAKAIRYYAATLT